MTRTPSKMFWHEQLEHRLLLASSPSVSSIQQAAAGPAEVLTATFKKNAPAAASQVAFSRLGKYATHAISAKASDLTSFAKQTGDTTATLYQRGIRETWWMGQRTQTVAGEWIVRFENFSGSARKQLTAARTLIGNISGVSVQSFIQLDGAFVLKTSEQTSYRSLATRLSAINGFRYVEPNVAIARPQAIPNDTTYSQQWAWPKIGAPAAWDVTTGSSEIVVAVLDTGVQVTHPDLAANIFVNPLETPGNGIDDDGNGYIDDVRGWNFGNNTATVDNGDHGTHVAGTIGAVGNNATGVTGMNWNVKILPVDIFPSSTTTSSYYIAAMSYLNGLKLRGVNVVASNNSYGSLGGTSSAVKDAIRSNADHNIMFIAAAGNDGQNVSSGGFSPATNGEPNSMAIAASTSTDSRSSFSNWGTNVDIAAPGSDIRSTTPTNNYGSKNGTSMASPHVAGLVGLAYSVVPNASYHQIKKAILDGGDPVNWSSTPTATNKRINAANTINLVRTHASGKVFLDGNRDGVQQQGEAAMRGWKVYNDANGNGSWDSTEAYANVQINGQYDLVLSAGAQNLKLENQSGYTITLGASGYAFNLAQYASTDGIDFAVAPTATGAIQGIVYADANGNGVRDTGEITVGGAAVYLDRNNNGVLDAASTFIAPNLPLSIADQRTVVSDLFVVRSDSITDVNVTVNITHTAVGNLRLTLIHPDGTRIRLTNNNGGSGDNFNNTTFDTQAATAITSASAPFAGTYRPVESLDTLNTKPATGAWQLEVSDTTTSHIGVLNSWSLTFNNATGDAVQYTGADGAYRFDGLAAGTYGVRVVPRAGFNTIAPTGGLWTQSLTAGQVVSDRNFALQPQSAFNPASIAGQFWYDGQANGTREPNDYALANWIAYLDTDSNGQIDVGEPFTLTDAQGNYRFEGLLPGTYSVRSAGFRGYSLSRPTAQEYSTTVAAGQAAIAGDFAFFQRGITGILFVDNNANGNKDSADTTGLSSYTIYLDANNNGSFDSGELSTTTIAGGEYSFVGLEAGTYTVRAVVSSPYILSGPSTGFHSVNLTATTFSTNRNFGVYLNATVAGNVYADANLNGAYDTGETYLSGWTVYHDVNNNGARDTGEPSATTNASGFYSIGGIKPGTQRIRVIPQSPYYPLLTLQSPVLTSGQYLSGQDFRVVHPSSLTYRDAEYASSNNPGWNWAYYEHGGISSVSSLDSLTPVRTGVTSTTGSTAVVNMNTPAPRADLFGIIWSGFVKVPVDDVYTFYTNSDDGSTLSIGNTLVVNNDGSHGAQERSGVIALRQGLHAITIKYFDGTGGNSISASWEASTISKAAIPSSAAFLVPSVPLASPGSLTADAVNGSRIDLAWSYNGTGHTGFVIERANDAAFTQGVQTFVVSSPTARTYSDLAAITGQLHHYRVRATDGTQQSDPSNTATATALAGVVIGRHVFYNNSYFDGNSSAATVADDSAIATDKVALRPGQGKASFANYTSYSRGINGVMVDIDGLAGSLAASDFSFRVGNVATPGAMSALATAPQIAIRAGQGVNGSDRVTLTWADGLIKNTWLEVTVKATANTGLIAPDVFYFGNVTAESGNVELNTAVNALDVSAVTANYSGRSFVGVTSRFDFNRDGKVDALDVSVVTANYSGRTLVQLIEV